MAQQMTIPAEINHTGMSAQWFDAAVQRSFERDVQVTDMGSGTYAMTSGSTDGLTYLVTATSCGCQGHAHAGRCYHRARALWETWANGTTEPEPPAPATVQITRQCPRCHGNGAVYRGETCTLCHGAGEFHTAAALVPVA